MCIVSVPGICLHYFPFVFGFFAGCIRFLASLSGNIVINRATRAHAFICNVSRTAWMLPRATGSVTVGTHLPLLLALHPLYSDAECGKARWTASSSFWWGNSTVCYSRISGVWRERECSCVWLGQGKRTVHG